MGVSLYWGNIYFGISMTDLFPPDYTGQPGWTWAKVGDLMKHIWGPEFIFGVTGTANMIRVIRDNLLDEFLKNLYCNRNCKRSQTDQSSS